MGVVNYILRGMIVDIRCFLTYSRIINNLTLNCVLFICMKQNYTTVKM